MAPVFNSTELRKEASYMSRSNTERCRGSCSNENFGRSSRKNGENPFRRIHEVSMAMFVNHGLVDPKITGNVSRRRATG